MSPFDLSSNFSNESSSLKNETCEVFDNSLTVTITKILAYSIILLCSLVGNALIIIIVYKREELRKTINYFIVNMAISDFVFPLTVIPVSLIKIAMGSPQWPVPGAAGLVLCKLKSFLEAVSITVSTESLVWIALDRFVAVVLPMKVYLISSRFRAFAIGSTWVVAMVGNSIYLYTFELTDENEEIICNNFYNTSDLTYTRVYTALFQIAPLIVVTILYLVIAVTLRRQDKALQCREVHQKDQRKRRAIKMSFCIMTAFSICGLPMLLFAIFWEYGITVSCSSSKALLNVASVMLFLSSAINPIICITFVQSYRRGLKEIFNSCWNNYLTTNDVAVGERDEIFLREIRVNRSGENLAFKESWTTCRVILLFVLHFWI